MNGNPTLPAGLGLFEQLQETARVVRDHIGDRKPTVGLVLGSGLGAYAETLTDPVGIEYARLPGFAPSTVSGHAGRLVVGHKQGVVCIAMQGRTHYYEGYSARDAVYPVRVLVALGAKTLVITNAAGGLRDQPGTLMVLRDHINLFPDHPLRGANDDRVGPRFPDMTEPYCPALRALTHQCAVGLGIPLAEGVYAGVQGPCYETPAEIRMLEILGANAVGMSTVPEVIAARHMGARVLGISCITNSAAGLGGAPLNHAEVTTTAARVRDQFARLLDAIVDGLREGR